MNKIRGVMVAVGRKMGVDMAGTPKELRVGLLALAAVLAVLIKTLVDQNVITDAQLQDGLDALELDPQDDEPGLP
jgi:hypothetical protein